MPFEALHNRNIKKKGSFMKRKTLLCAFLVIVGALLSFGTVSYFVTDGTAVNVITAGNIKVELLECSLKDGEKVPFENKISVVPDTSVSKIVTVKNTGNSPEYVRVSVNKEILSVGGERDENGDLFIEMDFNTEYWTERDGYWYYRKPLEGGGETEPLFTKVTFSKDMKNLYQNSTAKLDIKAFGVQSANNGDSPVTAVGWTDNR